MLSYFLTVAMLSTLACAMSVDNCPSSVKRDYFLSVHGNKCYRVELKYKVFEEAQRYCRKDGGNLAIVDSSNINTFLNNRLKPLFWLDKETFWIGLTFNSNTKKFYWEDGTRMKYENFPNKHFYGANKCVVITAGSGVWKNHHCEKNNDWKHKPKGNRFICEYQASIKIPDCPPNLKRDKYLKTYGDYCYRFDMNSSKQYQEAEDQCKKEGGNLAIVKSDGVNNFLQGQILADGSATSLVWIGLRYNSMREKLYWVDGTEMGYENFKSEVFTRENECVAMVAGSGNWEIFNCRSSGYFTTERSNFVCEFRGLVSNNTNTTATVTGGDSTTIDNNTTAPAKHSSEKDNCPVRVQHDKNLQLFGNKCYFFDFKQKLTFRDAENFCEKYGGTLALMKSTDVSGFIYNHMIHTHNMDRSGHGLWIGLHYFSRNAKNHWVDGTEVKSTNLRFKSSIFKELCMSLSPRDGKWENNHCSSHTKLNFICEFKARNVVPEVTSTTDIPMTTDCRNFICIKDCGLLGYKSNPLTGCMECECGD